MFERGHNILLTAAGAARMIALAQLALSAAFADAAETPIPSYMPLRAPLLARFCATPEEADLAERLTGFCAGYVRAILENDPRLGDCHPLMADVIEEIMARQRRVQLADDDVLARDFVVEVARDLCRQARPS